MLRGNLESRRGGSTVMGAGEGVEGKRTGSFVTLAGAVSKFTSL